MLGFHEIKENDRNDNGKNFTTISKVKFITIVAHTQHRF